MTDNTIDGFVFVKEENADVILLVSIGKTLIYEMNMKKQTASKYKKIIFKNIT